MHVLLFSPTNNSIETVEKTKPEEKEHPIRKPTFAERVVETDVSSGNFHRWKWVYTGKATDVATGITAKAGNYKSKDGAEKHAKINLKAILQERGIIHNETDHE